MKYVLSVIGMIIFGIIAVVLFSRMIRNTSNGSGAQIGVKQESLVDYVNDQSKVEFVQFGNVVSDKERRTLKITVSEKEANIEILKGYNETVERQETYGNNHESYNVFMHSLNQAGFTRKKVTTVSDPTGLCSTGLSYRYVLNVSSNDVTNLWNTSCQPLGGSLGSNGSLIRTLFRRQIPNYSDVVRGISFTSS